MRMDKLYQVVFGTSKDDRRVEMMTGKEILDSNRVYLNEKRGNRQQGLSALTDGIRGAEKQTDGLSME